MYLDDDSHLDIVGHGKVKIRILDGRVKSMNGVLYITSLAKSLLSISKLRDASV